MVKSNYQTHIQGTFPPIKPVVLIVAGNHQEYNKWCDHMYSGLRKSQYDRAQYVYNPMATVGYCVVDVILVGTWKSRSDIHQIFARLQYHDVRSVRTWYESPREGIAVFSLKTLLFPVCRKEKLSSYPII